MSTKKTVIKKRRVYTSSMNRFGHKYGCISELIDRSLLDTDKKDALKAEIEKFKDAKEKLEIFLKRKRKKNTESDDTLKMYFEPHIKQYEVQIFMYEDELEFVEAVENMIDGYEYIFEKVNFKQDSNSV